MASWADLSFDLVDSIAQRLHSSYATHIRFQVVCKSWRRCLNNNRRTRPQIPWLMLPYKQESTLRRFYCSVDKKPYHLDLLVGKEAEPTVCKGSFGGWSLYVEESSRLQLLNPLSKRLIHLPPLTTFPNVIHHDPNRLHEEYYIVHEHNRNLNYHRLCASFSTTSTSTTADPCVFMAIYGQCERLAFCRIGDENWSPVSTVEEHSFFQDVVFHDGKFYAGRQLMVLECDLHSLQQPQRIPVESPYHRTPIDISFLHRGIQRRRADDDC
ncbi:unnamed protein product [Linum trigynum]|uniref:KIB1-4 beta-propeller domain-containing protein n=1 Tax=Linum trigynum TaxID=586398 RepID=A0AAV2FDS2_9ROSI